MPGHAKLPAMTDTEPKSGLPLIAWVGFAVSAVFLYIFFRKVDFGQLRTVFAEARYFYLLPGLALMLCTYPIRAFRWFYLLPRLPGSTFRNRFSATVIGFMASSIFPLRAGEVVRAALFSIRSGIPLGVSIASIVLERVLDLIVVLMALGYCLAAFPGEASSGSLELARKAGMVLGAIVLCIVLFLVVLKAKPQLVRVPLRFILTLLPSQFADRIEKIVNSVIEGLTVVDSPLTVMGLLVLSIGHWSLCVVGTWVAAMAFPGLQLSLLGALLIFVFTSLAVALPQAPGFLGVYQVAVERSLAMLAVPIAPAQGFALVLWCLSILPITLGGFIAMSLEGLSLAEVSEARKQK